jgi:CubicO group peptidase (beta-lactamase class C family)
MISLRAALRRGGLTALLLLLTAGSVTAQHFPTESELRAVITERVDAGRSVGIVVGVVEATGSRTIVAYGESGPGARPLGPESVFEIGSITKVFTSILLADMAARGEVALDDAVQQYLPPGVSMPGRDGQTITFTRLATHRSGLPRMPTNFSPADRSNPFADYTPELLWEFLSGYTLTRDVGAQYEYSNVGAGLLGFVLASHVGKDYEALVQERILGPLGMDMSGIELNGSMREWLALGHNQNGDVVPNWDIPTLAGAGAIRSNVEDMLTFLEANMGEPTTDLQRAMRVSHESREEAGTNMTIGLGWHILHIGDDAVVWHNGGTGGYRTFAGFDPARRVGAVVLTNSARGADDIGFHLINRSVPLAAPREPVEERTDVGVNPEIMADYVGVYELMPGFEITVTLEDGQLQLQATGQPKFPLFAESETEFFLKVVDAQITFVRDDSGDVTQLVLHQAGQNQPGRKIR